MTVEQDGHADAPQAALFAAAWWPWLDTALVPWAEPCWYFQPQPLYTHGGIDRLQSISVSEAVHKAGIRQCSWRGRRAKSPYSSPCL